jgi:hypothetical protein
MNGQGLAKELAWLPFSFPGSPAPNYASDPQCAITPTRSRSKVPSQLSVLIKLNQTL